MTVAIDPREPGPLRWSGPYGEIRAQIVEELPSAIQVHADGMALHVRPLVEIEGTDPRMSRVLARMRERGG